jgi:hypothetical protein
MSKNLPNLMHLVYKLENIFPKILSGSIDVLFCKVEVNRYTEIHKPK